MPVGDLLEAMRPSEPVSEPPAPIPPSGRVAELIAKAKGRKPGRMSFGLDIDGTTATVEFVEIPGRAWSDLTATCPPRPGSPRDALIGYNSLDVVSTFPVSHEWLDGSTIPTVLVDDAPVSQEQWVEFCGYLDPAALEDAAAVLWAIHIRIPRDRHAAALAADGKEEQS